METIEFIKHRQKESADKLAQLKRVSRDIQSAMSQVTNGIFELEDLIGELPDNEDDETDQPINKASELLEELGLSTAARYSLMDIERLKIGIKWALEEG